MGIGNQKTAADTQQLIKKLEIRIIELDRQIQRRRHFC